MAIKLTKDYTKALGKDQDFITGTDGNDSFIAKVLGNSNTFQSGDEIDGGKGTDTLDIVLGNESGFAISAATTGVEKVSVRSQSTNGGDASAEGNSGDNNVSSYESADGDADENTIDAQDMEGVTQFWNTDSRADLVIEDVRIGGIANPAKNAKGQIVTENVTIGWKNTDPSSDGDKVDYHVFFSPESLRKSDNVDYINVQWMDTRAATDGDSETPLLHGLNYSGIQLQVNGKSVEVQSEGINAAGTYDELVVAFNDAFKEAGLSTIKAAKGTTFEARDTKSGETNTDKAFNIVITSSAGESLKFVKVLTSGDVDADSGLHSSPVTIETPDFITSKVVLDNVGRESEAGDLVIGSMSTRSGVDKFKVDVLRTEGKNVETMGNWVASMSSTNEKLQEVVITKNDGAYLYVGSNDGSTAYETGTANNDLTTDREIAAKGGSLAGAGFVNTDGLTDVRVFNASKMTGDVKVGATLANTDGADTTSDTSQKYNLSKMTLSERAYYDADDLNKSDALNDGFADGDGFVDFNYDTGKGNDTVNLAIADQCDVNINTGAGNDKIKLDVTVKLDGNTRFTEKTTDIVKDALDAQIIINAGQGSNQITLSKETAIASSNDTIVINGTNKVYNFNLGSDSLDFSAYNVGVKTNTFIDKATDVTKVESKEAEFFVFHSTKDTLDGIDANAKEDGSIVLINYTDDSKTKTVDETKVSLEKLYAADAKTTDVSEDHIVINSNDGNVYYAKDGVVSLVGTLNLYSDTTKAIAWSDLTAANFA